MYKLEDLSSYLRVPKEWAGEGTYFPGLSFVFY